MKDLVLRCTNFYEKKDKEMGLAVTHSQTYEVFLNMHAHIFLHMHNMLLATVSTATAAVKSLVRNRMAKVKENGYKFQL
jgi:hypothetical protein